MIAWWFAVGDGHWHIGREFKHQLMTAEAVAHEWHARNKEMGIKRVQYVAADPSMWAKTGHGKGESISETLLRYRLPMVKADNDRKNGWQRCHELFRLAPDGRPWVTIDSSCRYLWRSVPALMSDKRDPDDVNTDGDDHGGDAIRYGAMSRFVARDSRGTRPRPPEGSLGYYKQAAQQAPGLLSRRSA